MSHTGILENVVTTLVGTKQQAYQEHAQCTREVMHMSIAISFPKKESGCTAKLKYSRENYITYTDKERCATESCCRIENILLLSYTVKHGFHGL
jgi:hypothetical protein